MKKMIFTLPSVHSCPFDSVLEWHTTKKNFKIDPALDPGANKVLVCTPDIRVPHHHIDTGPDNIQLTIKHFRMLRRQCQSHITDRSRGHSPHRVRRNVYDLCQYEAISPATRLRSPT